MRNAFFLLLFVAIMPLPQSATDEFWISPEKFHVKKDEVILLKFLLGEDFTGETWTGNRERVKNFKQFYDEGERNILSWIPEKNSQAARIQFRFNGSHVLVLNTNEKYLELKAKDFNQHLKDEGLEAIINQRERTNQNKQKGREMYQRCVKSLVQVGRTPSEAAKKIYGQPLELVPLSNPYALGEDDNLTVQVLFNGQPLTGAMVKVWNKYDGQMIQTNYTTSAGGTITFAFNPHGDYLLSCAHMTPYTQSAAADWQSYWASLTFGFNR